MKRILLSLVCTMSLTPLCAQWLQKVPVDLPVHAVTVANLGTFIGVIVQKNRVYKKLRALLLEQINEENERTASEEGVPDDLSTRVRKAKKKNLIRFAFEVAHMRESLEAEIGEYELVKRLGGTEANKREKERVAACKRLAQDAMTYELWVPQLRTALFGTGAISTLMGLHRLGVFSSVHPSS